MAVGLTGSRTEVAGRPSLALLAHVVVGHQRAVVGAFEGLRIQVRRHREDATRAIEGEEPFIGVEHRLVGVDEGVAYAPAVSDAGVAHNHRAISGHARRIGLVTRAEEAEAGHRTGLMDEGLRSSGPVEALAHNHRAVAIDRARDRPATEIAKGGVGATTGERVFEGLLIAGVQAAGGEADGDRTVARDGGQLGEA